MLGHLVWLLQENIPVEVHWFKGNPPKRPSDITVDNPDVIGAYVLETVLSDRVTPDGFNEYDMQVIIDEKERAEASYILDGTLRLFRPEDGGPKKETYYIGTCSEKGHTIKFFVDEKPKSMLHTKVNDDGSFTVDSYDTHHEIPSSLSKDNLYRKAYCSPHSPMAW